MASGHVNRTNRPNTWLHRPATRREDSPCQLGAVHTWHIRDIARSQIEVRFRCKSGRVADITTMTGFDPSATWAAQDFRSAKALFVPSLKRDIVPFIGMHTTS